MKDRTVWIMYGLALITGELADRTHIMLFALASGMLFGWLFGWLFAELRQEELRLKAAERKNSFDKMLT